MLQHSNTIQYFSNHLSIQLFNITKRLIYLVMSEKKSPYIIAIQQALAQFDISTQVKKFTLQAMNSYMLGNKQAFSYIQEWEKKFIQFESRLSKAETYYQNIQSNINSKIEVTNSLNVRLQQFGQHFWETTKETTQSVQQMRKNYMNLVKQSGIQSSNIRVLEKQLKQKYTKVERLEDRIFEETNKLTQRIIENDEMITVKNNSYRAELEMILSKVSKAKAELDSRQQTLTQLCKDIGLYKDEKVTIISQLANLYQQINNRVVLSDFNQMRIYIDNVDSSHTIKSEQIHKQLNQKIEKLDKLIDFEISQRKRDIEQVDIERVKLQKSIEEKINNTNALIEKQKNILSAQIFQNLNNSQRKFKDIQQELDSKSESIQTIQNELANITQKIENMQSDILEIRTRVGETENNILSLNSFLKDMETENSKRGEQLAMLKVDANDKGDISEQLKKLTEKLLYHDDSFRKLFSENEEQRQKMGLMITDTTSHLKRIDFESKQNLQKVEQEISKKHEEVLDKLERTAKNLEKEGQDRHKLILETFAQTLKQKIESIKDKFDFLEQINKDMEIFKATFQEQLKLNDSLNSEIKEKMDRIFGMFTKMKSDAFLRIQTLSQDSIKSLTKIKENSKIITDISTLMANINQVISVLLSVFLWKEYQEDKDSPQQIKVASLIEGWVLELNKQKAKYRNQGASKRGLLQLCLESHVKTGDKYKGTLLQNGKQIFNRMTGGSEQYQQSRRKSFSRKKHRLSQLPKVYK